MELTGCHANESMSRFERRLQQIEQGLQEMMQQILSSENGPLLDVQVVVTTNVKIHLLNSFLDSPFTKSQLMNEQGESLSNEVFLK